MHLSHNILVLLSIIVMLSCGRAYDGSRLSDDKASAQRDPSTAVIGDSIATGVFAPTSVGVWPEEIRDMLREIISKLKFESVKDLTRSAIAKQINEKAHEVIHEDTQELRYATTNADWGLPYAVAQKNNIDVKNVKRFLSARFGATTRSAPDLLKGLYEQYDKHRKGFRAGYVVVMLGANDFCRELKPEEYGAKLKATMLELKESHPNATMVLVSLPPILALKDIDCDYEVKGKIKMKVVGKKISQDYTLPGGMSCEDIRRNYCEPLYRENAAEVVAEFESQAKGVYDDLRDGMDIRFAPLHETTIIKKQVAFDGFHPNIEGQKLISAYIRAEIDK